MVDKNGLRHERKRKKERETKIWRAFVRWAIADHHEKKSRTTKKAADAMKGRNDILETA